MPPPTNEHEEDALEKLREPHFYDNRVCCTRKGCMLFYRFFHCPCARPRTAPAPKDLAALKTIRLQVPDEEREIHRDNQVITSKYTPWDFLPLATTLQFRRAVNVYFLVQVILLMIGNFAPNLFEVSYTPWGTLLVLAFVIGVTLITEGYDDYYRHVADHQENRRGLIIIDPDTGKKRRSQWGALIAGDLVFLRNRELVPADVVVLQTAHENGRLYIETSGIDGETNLKIKQVATEMTEHIETLSALDGGDAWRTKFSGVFEYEEPNPILSFSGNFKPKGEGDLIPLSFENLVLRGSEVRNTQWVIAVCVYVGHDTKLVLSKKKTPSKFATIDVLINRIIFFAIIQSFIFTMIAVLVLFLDTPDTGKIWYFKFSNVLNAYIIPGPLAYIFTFINFFSNVVPIDLYVTIELANVVQSYVLTSDLQMYDAVTDTPAGTKTTNLISEIGQVSHVFSDKTGTLTQNVMRLVGCALPNGKGRFGVKVPDPMEDIDLDIENGEQPGQLTLTATSDMLGKRELNQRQVFADLLAALQDPQNNPEAMAFMEAVALCHTVIVDLDDAGLPRYNAEGPDEEALVKAAAVLGFVLKSTDSNKYEVFAMGETIEYEVLAVFPFTHDRKRMSVLLRRLGQGNKDESQDEAILLTKGADNVIAEKVTSFPDETNRDLSAFAQSGLRTLLFARRKFTMRDLKKPLEDFARAKQLIGKARKEAMATTAESLERDMELIGASAIEDALQEGVPETIQMLRDADIKVWVLTGDKVDTAVNIGFSSRLLDPQMHQVILVNPNTAVATMDQALEVLDRAADGAPLDADWRAKSLALIVDGSTLETLLDRQKGSRETEDKLIRLARVCEVVLACRVSPSQKALLLRACAEGEQRLGAKSTNKWSIWGRIRRSKRAPVTLAIGDGANDVAMIQQAKVGVGISGKEGLQAANSADFSIAQFRFLQRLLFVHGRWSYRRNATLFQYVCYSWQVLNWAIFFYLFYSMVSGIQVYIVTYYVTAFAWLCNAIIVGLAWFDRDISAETALRNPQCYDLGRLNQMLKLPRIFVDVFLKALIHSLIMYFIILACFPIEASIDVFGSSMYMGLFVIMTCMQMMIALTWTWVIIGGFIIIIAGYFIVISLIDIYLSEAGVALLFTYSSPTAYRSAFLVVGIVILFEYVFFGLRRVLFPTPLEALMEVDRGYGDKDTRPKLHGLRGAFEAVREGNDRVFVLPVKKAINLLRRSSTVKSGTSSQQDALLFQSGRQSGFIDSMPEGEARMGKSKKASA